MRLDEDDDRDGTIGQTEALLQREMHRRWLLWRDDERRARAPYSRAARTPGWSLG